MTESAKERYTISDLLDIMHRLRRECPWDAAQTHDSLRQYLLEETYEALEVLDKKEYQQLASELGDVLLQVVFHSVIAEEKKHFDFGAVVTAISGKLIERHPHVFGDETAADADAVQKNWELNKIRKENRNSALSGVPLHLPGLQRAQRLQEKAAAVGFEWNQMQGAIEKFEEEWQEFKEALNGGNTTEAEAEIGDLIFAIVNIARFLNLSSEDALRLTNEKFRRRFEYIENHFEFNHDRLSNSQIDDLIRLWNQAKANEKI
jgi:MazG family protein